VKNLTPLRSLRKGCLHCMGENYNQVEACHLDACPLHPLRLGRKPKSSNGKKLLTTVKSIKAHCLECSAFNKAEVRNCNIPDCVLYPFRMGKNPNIKNRKGNREALRNYSFLPKNKSVQAISVHN